MKIRLAISALLVAVPLLMAAQKGNQKLYRWLDDAGLVHYGDTIPAKYADKEKSVLNEQGVTIRVMHGKLTPEEKAEKLRLAKVQADIELQRRADRALLATYLSVEEIEMHRDRRVELFKAQSRVTELYLKNLRRRLDSLEEDAAAFQPYNINENAPMIDASLANELVETRATISRHEVNLTKYHTGEQKIVARFSGDVTRFKTLKGIE